MRSQSIFSRGMRQGIIAMLCKLQSVFQMGGVFADGVIERMCMRGIYSRRNLRAIL
jgi:hypothetical protein